MLRLERKGKKVGDIKKAIRSGLYGKAAELVKEKEGKKVENTFQVTETKKTDDENGFVYGLLEEEKRCELIDELEALKYTTNKLKTEDIEEAIENTDFGKAESLIEDRKKNLSELEEIKSELSVLEQKESLIDTRAVENAIDENNFDKARSIVDELKEDYDEYRETLGQLRKLDERKTLLAEQLADEKIDMDIYRDAKQAIDHKKAALEEELEKQREKVIYEDYQKPF